MYQLSSFALNTFAVENVRVFGLARASSRALPGLLPAHLPLILLVHHCFGCSAIRLAGTNAMAFRSHRVNHRPLSLPATKPKKSGFLSCAGPSAGGFTIPLATVLGQFGPKSIYECLYYLDTFNIYIYTYLWMISY